MYVNKADNQGSSRKFLLKLPKQVQSLNKDFSSEKVQEAIQGLHNNKVPGQDRIGCITEVQTLFGRPHCIDARSVQCGARSTSEWSPLPPGLQQYG